MIDTLFTDISESITEIIKEFQGLSLISQHRTSEEKDIARQASNKLYKVTSILEEAAFDIDPPDELAGEILLVMESAIENSYNGKINITIQILNDILERSDVQTRVQQEKNSKV